MMSYTPPLDDMQFVLEHMTGLDALPEHPDLGALDGDMVKSILEPAAKLAAEVLAPLNQSGDRQGCTLAEGQVTTPAGFKDAYAAYCEAGWNAVPFAPEYGGQGLPWLVAFALQEMWQGANMSFGLCPLLNQGAVEAVERHGTPEQKDAYLEKLISGAWTGTMNLTESQAGSDLSAIRCKAEKQTDGSYKITGQKIFITYGEHDFTDNIIHLVLARTPDAPEGVKGISLFIVPKFLAEGARNDVLCTGIEHKLGIHGSPTCTMQFGDEGGATGYLIGAENEGLKYMFTMMNNARLSVGLQGVAVAEAASQRAYAYAQERVQGAALADKGAKVAIAAHPDVKRMILTMRALTQAGRAMTYEAALALDLAAAGDKAAAARADLLTPVVKAWCTDLAQEVTSLGVQVHGGMGYIEETGAAQLLRDARILPIYEGTNGIQALDMVFRKLVRDGGEAALAYCEDLRPFAEQETVMLVEATQRLCALARDNPDQAASVSVPYLQAFGVIAGGAAMARAGQKATDLLDSAQGNPEFLTQKIAVCRFYSAHILPRAQAHLHSVSAGGETVIDAVL